MALSNVVYTPPLCMHVQGKLTSSNHTALQVAAATYPGVLFAVHQHVPLARGDDISHGDYICGQTQNLGCYPSCRASSVLRMFLVPTLSASQRSTAHAYAHMHTQYTQVAPPVGTAPQHSSVVFGSLPRDRDRRNLDLVGGRIRCHPVHTKAQHSFVLFAEWQTKGTGRGSQSISNCPDSPDWEVHLQRPQACHGCS